MTYWNNISNEVDFCNIDFFTDFIYAYEERRIAVRNVDFIQLGFSFETNTASGTFISNNNAQGAVDLRVPSSGEQSLVSISNAISPNRNWAGIQAGAELLKRYFIRHIDSSGHLIQFDRTNNTIHTWFTYERDVDNNALFPYPSGWIREYPKEIFRLDMEGTPGERARFTFRERTRWTDAHSKYYYRNHYMDDVTTSFNSSVLTGGSGINVTTPINERHHSLKMFDYIDGSGWIESEDQFSPPSVIMASGRAETGDYFTRRFVQQLYDAYNQLVWTGTTGIFYHIRSVFGGACEVTPYYGDMEGIGSGILRFDGNIASNAQSSEIWHWNVLGTGLFHACDTFFGSPFRHPAESGASITNVVGGASGSLELAITDIYDQIDNFDLSWTPGDVHGVIDRPRSYTEWNEASGPNLYSAIITHQPGRFVVATPSGTSGINREIEMYIWPVSGYNHPRTNLPEPFDTIPMPYEHTGWFEYDDLGTGYEVNKWNIVGSVQTSGYEYIGPLLRPIRTHLPFNTSVPGKRGFAWGSYFAIVKWDVPSGFVYTANTPPNAYIPRTFPNEAPSGSYA